MIIPSAKLIQVAAVVLIGAGLTAAIWPLSTIPLLGLLLFLGLLLGLDGYAAQRRIFQQSVEAPASLRMTRGRNGSVELTVRRGDRLSVYGGRIALPLPENFQAEQDYLTFQWNSGADEMRLSWPWRAEERGVYTLDNLYLETDSPRRWWSGRRAIAMQMEIHVYPDMLGERHHAPSLFLRRGALGIHPHRQVGRGRDFEKLREYQPGDGYEDIHWKATARRGYPVTKLYQIERTQEVYVVVDTSRLSGRPNPGVQPPEPQLEQFLSAALAVGLAAERQGDHFGVLTYSDRVDTFVRAKSGKRHFTACREALCAVQARKVSPDFAEVSTFLQTRLHKRALLIWLANLDDPIAAESFLQHMELVRKRHLVLVNMIQGPELRPLFAGTAPDEAHELATRLARHLEWRALRQLQSALRQQGVRLALVEHAQLTPTLIQQYVDVKQRQAL